METHLFTEDIKEIVARQEFGAASVAHHARGSHELALALDSRAYRRGREQSILPSGLALNLETRGARTAPRRRQSARPVRGAGTPRGMGSQPAPHGVLDPSLADEAGDDSRVGHVSGKESV